MELTFNKDTALSIIRALRSSGRGVPKARVELVAPDPAPHKRWSKQRLRELLGGHASQSVYIAVPAASKRIKTKGVHSTVYASPLPNGSFVRAGRGVRISSPEMLFVELAPHMTPLTHLLLGFELCGTFSRDSRDPRDGDVTFFVPPVTSVARIRTYVEHVKGLHGIEKARETLSFLSDNAWSPTEALIAAMAALPVYRMGYGCHDVRLNQRVTLEDGRSRVPDILFGDTQVGINYDGGEHLDLESIERAARAAERSPDKQALQRAVSRAKSSVRNKVVDDLRRNRELGTKGYVVFPVTKEDLYQDGGLDKVMRQLYETIERFSGQSMEEQRRSLVGPLMKERRQQLVWAVMPGERGKEYLRLLSPPDGKNGHACSMYKRVKACTCENETSVH